MLKLFKVTYTSGETENILAYSAEFRPGFVSFYNGETERSIGAGNIAEIETGVYE